MLGTLGRISRRKSDGRWMGRYTLNKVQKSVYGATSKEVKAKYDNIYNDYHNVAVKPMDTEITVCKISPNIF